MNTGCILVFFFVCTIGIASCIVACDSRCEAHLKLCTAIINNQNLGDLQQPQHRVERGGCTCKNDRMCWVGLWEIIVVSAKFTPIKPHNRQEGEDHLCAVSTAICAPFVTPANPGSLQPGRIAESLSILNRLNVDILSFRQPLTPYASMTLLAPSTAGQEELFRGAVACNHQHKSRCACSRLKL